MSDESNKKNLFTRILPSKRDPDSLRFGLRTQRPLLVWSLVLFTFANSADMASNVMLMRLVDQALAGQFDAVRQTLIIILAIFLVIIPVDILHIRLSSKYVKNSMLVKDFWLSCLSLTCAVLISVAAAVFIRISPTTSTLWKQMILKDAISLLRN